MCGPELMGTSVKVSLIRPCFTLSRRVQSACSFSSQQWSECHLQRISASASIKPSANKNGVVGFVALERERSGSAWRNPLGLAGVGVRAEKIYLHQRNMRKDMENVRMSFSTRSCALDKIAGNACGETSDSSLGGIVTGTGLISRTVPEPAVSELLMPSEAARERKWSRKCMCYYFSQGLCTLMEDELHLSRFSHEYPDMSVRADDLEKVKPQPFSYFLVLDLEGMVEILEFPVLMLDAKTLQVVDRFHRFVRPCKMSEDRIQDYIRNKYGKWGLDRVWHDTAIPFTDVLPAFEGWLESHGLFDTKNPSKLETAAFVTCGNWDVKTKIPEQCVTSEVPLPPYFNEWINLKDIYFNFYKFRAGGMLAMMKGLKMPMEGTHHVGLDDAHNITRILQRMLAHGVVMTITAKRRAGGDPKAVKFTFRFRIK